MKFNLDKKNKYVVACSFGPDSMALLDMLIKEKYKVIVAHVNYHKRDASNFEEESVRKYCLEKNVPCEVLDTAGMKCDKNFQEWAREVRYDFFKKVSQKYGAAAVLVAHQQDDLIETFLMQQKRKSIVKQWGIAEEITIFDVRVIRPLLGYSKQELLKYDDENNVPYAIDISNLSDDYERNRIRHSTVEKLTKDERTEILNKIANLNKDKTYAMKDNWSVMEFLILSDEEIVLSISKYLSKFKEHVSLSASFVLEIKKAFSSSKTFVEIELTDNISLIKDYDFVYFSNSVDPVSYLYKINKRDIIDDGFFYIDLSNGQEERNVSDEDYPLMVKPVDKKDVVMINDYSCEVRRLFIDWKVPHYYRNIWPGIYNKDGKLIYVPRYREQYVDSHTSKFVIKFAKIGKK